MSKLPKENKFLDLSDYGRPVAKMIASTLKNTIITPIHVTLGFVVSGFIAVFFIVQGQYWLAALFLILKSILDAADGELARMNQKPSYTGRYLDSVSDILLNAMFFMAIWYVSKTSFLIGFLAFLGLQLQGTLYNYYYVILRNKYEGDTTSRVFENLVPVAFENENQKHVNFIFTLYKLLYGIFDQIIYKLDKNANQGPIMPNWFMTSVSTFGLGFQLLIISCMLVFGLENYIFNYFLGYSIMIFVFIGIRKIFY
jgi:phosphatidylglycerophosphate synthase